MRRGLLLIAILATAHAVQGASAADWDFDGLHDGKLWCMFGYLNHATMFALTQQLTVCSFN